MGVGGRNDPANNVRSFPELIKELGHTQIDLIKMDIEGSEFDVVASLSGGKVVINEMIIEIHNPTMLQVTFLLISEFH